MSMTLEVPIETSRDSPPLTNHELPAAREFTPKTTPPSLSVTWLAPPNDIVSFAPLAPIANDLLLPAIRVAPLATVALPDESNVLTTEEFVSEIAPSVHTPPFAFNEWLPTPERVTLPPFARAATLVPSAFAVITPLALAKFTVSAPSCPSVALAPSDHAPFAAS